MYYIDHTKNVLIEFEAVRERDIDLLLMEEFSTSSAFVHFFVDNAEHAENDARMELDGGRVVSVEHSIMDAQMGETDIEIIFENSKARIGLLIEDKINAEARPTQASRYFERGNKGINKGKYARFYVCIVAPQKYLDSHNHGKNTYPYWISYEKMLEYYSRKCDPGSIFKVKQIRDAIDKQRRGYQTEEDPRVTAFWRKYAAYQKQYFPGLMLRYNGEIKGTNATWPRFDTAVRGLYLYHKTEYKTEESSQTGVVDLTFDGYGDRISDLMGMIDQALDGKWGDYSLQRTGKAASLRLSVPKLNVHGEFDDQIESAQKCFEIIKQISDFAKRLKQVDLSLR